MFYVDLEEIDGLTKKLSMFSRNKFNFFSFCDKEHLQFPIDNPDTSKTTREHITTYLKEKGIEIGTGRIMLLTNMNVLGYNFNPVSFYFCYNEQNEIQCAIAEVSNTFREMKPYLLSKETLKDGKFHLNTTKFFYVSPFIDHDTNFDFNLVVPDEKLNIRIDDYKNGERFFISTLTGTRVELTNSRLFWYSLRFPFITIKIISLIHWNALKLWLKKIRYHKKGEYPELQKDVHNRYKG
jgi:DUF1365 family protein